MIKLFNKYKNYILIVFGLITIISLLLFNAVGDFDVANNQNNQGKITDVKNVKIGESARQNGDIILNKGNVEISNNAVVDGSVILEGGTLRIGNSVTIMGKIMVTQGNIIVGNNNTFEDIEMISTKLTIGNSNHIDEITADQGSMVFGDNNSVRGTVRASSTLLEIGNSNNFSKKVKVKDLIQGSNNVFVGNLIIELEFNEMTLEFKVNEYFDPESSILAEKARKLSTLEEGGNPLLIKTLEVDEFIFDEKLDIYYKINPGGYYSVDIVNMEQIIEYSQKNESKVVEEKITYEYKCDFMQEESGNDWNNKGWKAILCESNVLKNSEDESMLNIEKDSSNLVCFIPILDSDLFVQFDAPVKPVSTDTDMCSYAYRIVGIDSIRKVLD